MAQLRWRVKLVAERPSSVTTETELACIERDEQISLAELGLRLDKAKRVTKAPQAEMVPAQMAALGRVPARVRGVRARAGEQGLQRGAVPLVVRRRAGASAAPAGLRPGAQAPAPVAVMLSRREGASTRRAGRGLRRPVGLIAAMWGRRRDPGAFRKRPPGQAQAHQRSRRRRASTPGRGPARARGGSV